MGLNICFVSYWGINEGLTQATVLPHLKILAPLEAVDQVNLITIERSAFVSVDLGSKTSHIPLRSSKQLVNKVFDRFNFKRIIKLQFIKNKPDLIIARSSLAAWLIQDYAFKNQIPLVVESFEPHAEYMIEAGEWSKSGLKAKTLNKAETLQKQKAKFILPLTEKYSQRLVYEGTQKSKLMVMPCCVDLNLFRFDEGDRNNVRAKLGISSDKIIGVYTGKIGGIYLEKEAIELFKRAGQFFKEKFHLLILSPERETWRQELIKAGFSEGDFSVDFVPQYQVPKYLSAADFAFSLHKPTPSKKAISPIKNAEFWANGLPIMMPDGIGDDSEITRNQNLGVVVEDFDNINNAVFDKVEVLRKSNRSSNQCVQFAKDFRSFDIVESCYLKIIASLAN